MQDQQLGMDRIRQALAHQCQSDRGAARALLLAPAAGPDGALASMAAISEARALLDLDLAPGILHRLDVDTLLDLARRGGVLAGEDLLHIGRLVRCAARTQDRARAWAEQARGLAAVAESMPVQRLLADLIEEAIDDGGELLDSASDELGRLRAEVRRRSGGLRTRIAELMRETDDLGMLQDDYYTVREGRFVLPVKSSDKRHLDGIVHGSSHTGQTVYIEPRELIEANNRLTMLNDEVRREERRILGHFSSMVASNADDILICASRLAALDGRFAAARLGAALGATTPAFSTDGQLRLRRGRHPLLALDGARVVPNDIDLQPPARWLVVSGPNGGGKTVVLTTVGLAVEMARHGLPVCADEGSVLPWFSAVHMVLGDAQDLDRGLSTFSGHLERVVDVLRAIETQPAPLVLLDELAAGTEPSAGSALATAILEAFGERACHGLVSTHYEAVKLLPLRLPPFANAALDLDPRSMAPDFRLRLGEVGSSSPFALADRMALPGPIVERARQIAGVGSRDTEQLLTRLRSLRGELEVTLAEATREKQACADERGRLEAQRKHEQREADRRIERAAGEALTRIAELRRELEQVRRELRKRPEGKSVEQISADLARQQRLARSLQTSAGRGQAGADRAAVDPAALHPDAPVWHTGLQRLVTVVDAPLGAKRVRVQAGSLKMTVALDELRVPNPGDSGLARPRRPPSGPPTALPDHRGADDEDAIALRTAQWTRDLRGMRIEEALLEVDAHLDAAIVQNALGVCLVHGLGTGALRQAIRAHLRAHPQVSRQRPGQRGEGGDGVTLVWVKQ